VAAWRFPLFALSARHVDGISGMRTLAHNSDVGSMTRCRAWRRIAAIFFFIIACVRINEQSRAWKISGDSVA